MITITISRASSTQYDLVFFDRVGPFFLLTSRESAHRRPPPLNAPAALGSASG